MFHYKLVVLAKRKKVRSNMILNGDVIFVGILPQMLDPTIREVNGVGRVRVSKEVEAISEF